MFTRTDCRTSNYYYETIQVKVLENGCYKFVSNSTVDTYGYICEDYFKPVTPSDNLFLEIGRGRRDGQFEVQTSLLIDTIYILAVSTLEPNVTGVFSVMATGPNTVNFTRISECV